MIYIAIATLGNQENIDRLLSAKFWEAINQEVACIHVLSQVEAVRIRPHRGLIVEYNETALGCGGARQKIVDYVLNTSIYSEDMIVFLDDDIQVLSATWLEQLIAPLREGYDISGVEGRKLTKKMPRVDNKHFDYLSGGWLAAKVRVFDYACRFDLRYYPNYWEDADLALQARERGFKMACVGDIGLRHDEKLKPGQLALLESNRAKFYEKWGLSS